MSKRRPQVGGSGGSALRAVATSPRLRRLQLAYLLSAVGWWAGWVAVVVFAYQRGGAAEAGVVAAVQLLPAIVLTPVVASVADRRPAASVLLGVYGAQAAATAAVALAMASDVAPLLVYAAAVASCTSMTMAAPIHAALVPDVVATPDELTAANATSGGIDGMAALAGPAAAGFLVGIGGPALVYGASTAGLLVAVGAVIPIARAGVARHAVASRTSAPAPPAAGLGRAGGLRALATDSTLLGIVLLLASGTFLVGAMDILYAVLAIDLLRVGPDGVGYLGAAGGLGALTGSALAVMLVGRRQIGLAMAAGLCAFGAGIAIVGLVPGVLPAAVFLIAAGIGNGFGRVAGLTLVQRRAPTHVRAQVLGTLQGLSMGTTALGAVTVPLFVAAVGGRGALVAAGLVLPALVVVLGRALLVADREATDRTREIAALRGVPFFAPLPPPTLEAIARSVVHEWLPAGAVVIRQGDPGDAFYVVLAGRLAVTVDGQHRPDIGPGGFFGEIALLRDVPRTATVTALEDVELLRLDRHPFLEAVTGLPRSRSMADAVAERRLSTAAADAD